MGVCEVCGGETKGEYRKCYSCFSNKGTVVVADEELFKLAVDNATRITVATMIARDKSWDEAKLVYPKLIKELVNTYKEVKK